MDNQVDYSTVKVKLGKHVVLHFYIIYIFPKNFGSHNISHIRGKNEKWDQWILDNFLKMKMMANALISVEVG